MGKKHHSIGVLCVVSEFKGTRFIESMKDLGAQVYVVTSQNLKNKPWPKESIDELFFVEAEENQVWNMSHVISGMAWIMQTRQIDVIVAIDDFDVEKAAELREHFRIAGMGITTSHYFRDKLAMRMKAAEANISEPAFSALFNQEQINQFLAENPGPYLIKPRNLASTSGIVKVKDAAHAYQEIERLGARRHEFLIECFKPGDVYHVDSLTKDGEVQFQHVSKYLSAPLEVTQGDAMFRSITLAGNAKIIKKLKQLDRDILKAFGMQYSASHTEFIHYPDTDDYYFLETSSRVGGAHIPEMIEAATGVNLWEEWAKIEYAFATKTPYTTPKSTANHAGLIISMIEKPVPIDYSEFNDDEIVWTLNKPDHIGFIFQSKRKKRIIELLDQYIIRIQKEYF